VRRFGVQDRAAVPVVGRLLIHCCAASASCIGASAKLLAVVDQDAEFSDWYPNTPASRKAAASAVRVSFTPP
jgi:hypothetical protein